MLWRRTSPCCGDGRLFSTPSPVPPPSPSPPHPRPHGKKTLAADEDRTRDLRIARAAETDGKQTANRGSPVLSKERDETITRRAHTHYETYAITNYATATQTSYGGRGFEERFDRETKPLLSSFPPDRAGGSLLAKAERCDFRFFRAFSNASERLFLHPFLPPPRPPLGK